MAARSAPQLRVFRNDFTGRGAAVAVRLVGRHGNRDAVGARVTVETDLLRRTKAVQAGSGFLSQHSKELLFGLGHEPARDRADGRVARRRRRRSSPTFPLNHRLRIEEGGEPRAEPFRTAPSLTADAAAANRSPPPSATWLYEPFPAPDFSLPDLRGAPRSLSALRGRPAVASSGRPRRPSRARPSSRWPEGPRPSLRPESASLPSPSTPPEDLPKVRAAAGGVTAVPVVLASEEVGRSYAILNRHLFMNRQDLRLPTAFLLDAEGRVVKAYRDRVDVAEILRDVPRIEAPAEDRLARALPFAGTFHSPLGARNYLPYGRELLDQGLEAAAVVAFERAAQGSPSASTLYRLGTLLVKSGETTKARAAFERALAMQPDLSEASNDLGTLLAQGGDLPAAIEKFRAALATTPDYPDALNNLGYALLLSGRAEEARALYEKALKLQPDFPEALNNLGLIHGREGEMDRAEHYFREALAKQARLRGGREQPGPGPRRSRPARRGDPPPRGVPGDASRFRKHVHHAGEDPPGRESPAGRTAGHRAPPAEKPHAPSRPRDRAAVQAALTSRVLAGDPPLDAQGRGRYFRPTHARADRLRQIVLDHPRHRAPGRRLRGHRLPRGQPRTRA